MDMVTFGYRQIRRRFSSSRKENRIKKGGDNLSSLYLYYKELVMGLISKSKKIVKQSPAPKEVPAPKVEKAAPELNKQELEFLLRQIKEGTFKGSELQKVYSTTMKLQEMFLLK